jgi:hypothetical protein
VVKAEQLRKTSELKEAILKSREGWFKPIGTLLDRSEKTPKA